MQSDCIALSFAAGAMIYVVIEELIPESQLGKNYHQRANGLHYYDEPGCSFRLIDFAGMYLLFFFFFFHF